MDSPNVHSPQQEIVSQAEVESLLAQAGGADSSATAVDVKKHQPEPGSVQPYKFRELSSLTAGELRKLEIRHEDFFHSLAARLSVHLRLDVGVQTSKLETSHFQKFLDGISNSTYLALLKLEPLHGVCLLNIPARLGLCIVDRELGGPGQYPDNERSLSEIEARLLSRVVEIIAGEWCSIWSDLLDLRAVLLGHESSGGFVQTSSPDDMMLILGMEVRIGEMTEPIQFCFPCATLEPLILKLNSGIKAEKTATVRAAAPLKWNPVLGDVNIKVTAQLPDLELTAKQLARLKPGDTLLITPEMAKQVRLCLAKKPKFSANLGTCNQRWAAKIVQLLGA